MSDPVKPALTPEEWEFYRIGTYDLYVLGDGGIAPIGAAPNRHALAALALKDLKDKDGKPLGFTREDLQFLRDRIFLEWGREVRKLPIEEVERFENFYQRVKALVPPEGP